MSLYFTLSISPDELYSACLVAILIAQHMKPFNKS